MHTYINKLLKGEKVEWKTLGEVAGLKRGRVMSKEYLADNKGDYSVYSSQTANNGEIGKINTFDFEGEFVTWTTDGANAGTVFYRNGKFSITNVCGLVILNDLNQLNYKFIYYWLCIEAKKYVYSGMGNPKLMSNQMEKIKIPIPPLSVQEKIAEILDRFTQLEAELEAELVLRKKQYHYYRNHLLTPDENNLLNGKKVEWKTLGDIILHLRTGLNPRKNFVLNTDDANNYYITVRELGGTKIKITDKTDKINDEALKIINNRSKLKVGDVLFSGTGTIGNTAIVSEEPKNWNIKEGVYAITPSSEIINSMFLLRLFQSENFVKELEKKAMGGIVKSVSMSDLKKIQIPIPPMEEQERIVKILDTFDTLINSISEGLPKEIELRRKQYEYYREQLLQFS